ncbi:MAG: branched-chain amino acid aminotransferase [Clostridia bacterium]|nr:branched-chain amino acid aminotransferase [Clostridia bacterium]
MEVYMKITISSKPKAKPDFSKLGFGKYFTDHMLLMEYHNGAWGEPEIIPYDDFKMNPATNILHYGQGIFEGVKAYKDKNGKITTFRIDENIKRMNRSAERLCMPTLDADVVIPAIFELIKLEQEWIPTEAGTALYIRPTMIADDPMLGVHAAHNYKFFVILSPVGAYYANGLQPTKIMVEEHYVRAPLGGTGEAKCMGNYAASLLASEIAISKGYDQVLWLDAVEHKYAEEVGAMNMFFVIDGEVITPALVGSILPGITRKSSIELLKSEGYKVTERRISLDEIAKAYDEGRLNEAFGTGTAAVVSPVGVIHYNGRDMIVNNQEMGPITADLYEKLTGIQYGKREDKFGWIFKIN